jgi:nicotinamidase-related amidase
MVALERMTHRDGGLLIIDAQDKLLTLIENGPLVVANAVRLVQAARELGVPHWATEQYPRGLGPTTAALAELIPHRPPKTAFHCCVIPEIVEQLHGRKIRHVTLAGIEAHVCVAQTALELLKMGFRVQVPADAVASRGRMDWEFALRRLEHAGAVVTTTEAVLFEWVECSDSPHFKVISALVKDFVRPRPTPEDPRRADLSTAQ